ncbi:MAG: FkbM family methyltransferase [Ruminococcus sp.]|nr:FkbM family methyltransferase [Ruminococcus sp.]
MRELFKNQISVWENFKNSKKPVILYGMGDGADKVLSAFEKYGISAYGVMASDEFVRGQSFHGFTVKKLSDFEQELGDFNIALCFASQLEDVMNTIKSVAAKHNTLVPSVPVFGDILFDDDFIKANSEKINQAYSLMADDLSKSVYKNILSFYYTGKLELLDEITTDKDEAFNNILKLGSNEVYLDLGAYNGDTIDEFLHYSGGTYRKIIAFEPNSKNFEKLKKHCENMDKVELWQLGAYSKNTILYFNNKAGRNSAITESGTQTRVATPDTILAGIAASYIKADVEGADFQTLLGMKNTLKTFKPKLNFSAYHRFEDIFELPLLIKQLNSDYKIFMRHHPYIPAWDTNLYCI